MWRQLPLVSPSLQHLDSHRQRESLLIDIASKVEGTAVGLVVVHWQGSCGGRCDAPASSLPQPLFCSPNLVLVVLTPFARRDGVNWQAHLTGMLVDELLSIDGSAIGIERAIGQQHLWLVDPKDGEQVCRQAVRRAHTHGCITHIREPGALDDRYTKRVARGLMSPGACRTPSLPLATVIDKFFDESHVRPGVTTWCQQGGHNQSSATSTSVESMGSQQVQEQQ